jgi:hypothetical protein
LGIRDRLLKPALGAVTLGQSLQGYGQFLAELFTLKELPPVELRAIRQGEAGHEVAGVEAGGFGQEG